MRENGYAQTCVHSERASEQSVTGLSLPRVQLHAYEVCARVAGERSARSCELAYRNSYICSYNMKQEQRAGRAQGRAGGRLACA